MSNIISISFTHSDDPVIEPVTLDDMKAYLRVDFTDDDDLITALISAARSKCEKILGMVLVDTTIKALYEVHGNRVHGYGYVTYPTGTIWGGLHRHRKNRFEIFYGPVLEESGVPAFTGLPDDAEIKGHGFSVWIETYDCSLDISYSSGWDMVPEWANLAIKKQVAWDYESRGDQLLSSRSNGISTSRIPDIAPETSAILSPYRVNLSDILL